MAETKKEKVVKEVEKENVVEFKEKPVKVEENNFERVAPQWIIYNKVCQFLDDPEISIEEPNKIEDVKDTYEIVISSSNYHKIVGLAKAFKAEVDNVQFKFEYEGEDNEYFQTLSDIFEGNKHFDNIRIAVEAMSGIPVIITTFKDETVQYKADNRFVPGGYSTTLEETLVKEFFKGEYRRSVYVTKDKEKSYDWPLVWSGESSSTILGGDNVSGYVTAYLDDKE